MDWLLQLWGRIQKLLRWSDLLVLRLRRALQSALGVSERLSWTREPNFLFTIAWTARLLVNRAEWCDVWRDEGRSPNIIGRCRKDKSRKRGSRKRESPHGGIDSRDGKCCWEQSESDWNAREASVKSWVNSEGIWEQWRSRQAADWWTNECDKRTGDKACESWAQMIMGP